MTDARGSLDTRLRVAADRGNRPAPRRFDVAVAFTALMLACAATGCRQPVRDLYDPAATMPAKPVSAYAVGLWDSVLRTYARDGLVDYDGLLASPEDLEAFLDHIAFVGPRTTPALFPTIQARTAYYLNAYNVCVVAAVLAQDIPPTMHDFDRGPLDAAYRFRVDGRIVTLGQIRALARAEAADDARVEFALCDAAMGSAPLHNRAFQPDLLARQLIRLAQDAVSNTRLVRVDHGAQRLYLGMAVWSRKQAFIDTYKRETGSESGTLLNCLMHLATPVRRESLNRAVGYETRLLPFDRSLNRRDATAAVSAADPVASGPGGDHLRYQR